MKRTGRNTWELHNFGAGIDLRDGLYSADQNRFRRLENLHVTKGKKIRRRPPLIKVEDEFSANCLGLVVRDGLLYTFAPRGAVTTTPTDVGVIAFDIPPGGSAHVLTDVGDMNDTLVALFQHTVNGAAQYFLHVFDSAPDRATYVTDCQFPWLHYTGTLPRAVLATAANKIYLSGPLGNTYHCGVARPRTWWTRTLQDILDLGYEFHYYAAASGSQTVTVPVNAALVGSLTSGFVAWVVEKYTATGTALEDFQKTQNWATRMTEVTGSPASGECKFGTTTNTSTGATYTNWVQVTINATAAGWHRIRFLPPRGSIFPVFNYVVSGALGPAAKANGGVNIFLRGDGVQQVFELPEQQFHYVATTTCWSVWVDGVAQVITVDYSVGNPVYKRASIIFAAPPADGTSIQILLLCFGFGGKYVVPPGVINTLLGQKKWPGGEVSTPGSPGYYNLQMALDVNGNPTGISFVAGPGVTGKQLYENVILAQVHIPSVGSTTEQVPIYNGQIVNEVTDVYTPGNYFYRNQASDEKQFQQAKLDIGATDVELDAGFLPTASHDSSGGFITALVGVKNRLLVYFKGGSQLWAVNENGNEDTLLSKSPVGTGAQPSPFGTLFEQAVIMPSINGLRMVSASGELSDRIGDTNVGEPIEKLGLPEVVAAAHWPWMNEYVAACEVGGYFMFLVLDYSKESKIAAWSKWTAVGISDVDYRCIIAVNDRLYLRTGTDLYYYDAAVYTDATPDFADTNDDNPDLNPGQEPYQSLALWNYNDFKKPGTMKRFCFLDLVQTGSCTVAFKFLPYSDDTLYDAPEVPIAGTTVGQQRIGLSMTAEALAPQLSSTNRDGWELERIELDFMYLRRTA